MSYVEGAMLGAHIALCRKGDDTACKRAHSIAQACFDYESWRVCGSGCFYNDVLGSR